MVSVGRLPVAEPLISDQSLELGYVSVTFRDVPSQRCRLRIFTGQKLIEGFLERRSLIKSLLRQIALIPEHLLEVDLNMWHRPQSRPGGWSLWARGHAPKAQHREQPEVTVEIGRRTRLVAPIV